MGTRAHHTRPGELSPRYTSGRTGRRDRRSRRANAAANARPVAAASRGEAAKVSSAFITACSARVRTGGNAVPAVPRLVARHRHREVLGFARGGGDPLERVDMMWQYRTRSHVIVTGRRRWSAQQAPIGGRERASPARRKVRPPRSFIGLRIEHARASRSASPQPGERCSSATVHRKANDPPTTVMLARRRIRSPARRDDRYGHKRSW